MAWQFISFPEKSKSSIHTFIDETKYLGCFIVMSRFRFEVDTMPNSSNTQTIVSNVFCFWKHTAYSKYTYDAVIV